VIGTRMHVLVIRRVLRNVARRVAASPATGSGSTGAR